MHYFVTLTLLLVFFHLGVMEAVLHKLSLSQSEISYAMLLAILLSLVNVQLFRLKVSSVIKNVAAKSPVVKHKGICRPTSVLSNKRTFEKRSSPGKERSDEDDFVTEEDFSASQGDLNEGICFGVNIGGCILPILFSLYLLRGSSPDPYSVLLLVVVVSGIVYPLSRVEGRRGLVINLFGAIVSSAIGGVLLGGDDYLAWAYMAAVLGTLIGGDLFHVVQLSRVKRSWRQGVFVGGAGLMDAIFLSGLFAMMVAEVVHEKELLRVVDHPSILQSPFPKKGDNFFSKDYINSSKNNTRIEFSRLDKENNALTRIETEWIHISMRNRINNGFQQQAIRTGCSQGIPQSLS